MKINGSPSVRNARAGSGNEDGTAAHPAGVEIGQGLQDAAQRLGMSRATLYRKVAHYGIKVRAARPDG
jgi:transcriptional regulator of acetoin/glycerol metabolism